MASQFIYLSLKNLRHRGLRSWLTILGVFIGIAAVVSLISLGQGLQQAITGQFSTLDVDKLIIENTGTGFGPPGSTSITKLTEHDLQIIEEVNGVEFVIPRLVRVVKVEYNDMAQFNYITSVPESSEEIRIMKDSLNLEVERGEFLEEGDSGSVVLGSDIADSFDKEIIIGSKITLQGKDFTVKGILQQSGTFQVNQVIFMQESKLKDILNIGDEIDLIVAQVEDEDEIPEVAERIRQELRNDRDQKEGEEDFSVQTPSQSLDAVNTILNIINLIVVGIAAVSLLIGGIGIANTMFTSVLERTKEIGTMKAVGAQNRDILLIFIIESGLLGLVGGLVGAGAGLGMAFLVSGIANSALGSELITVSPSIPLLLASISFSFFVGIIAGLVPAYKASNLKPVEALRQ